MKLRFLAAACALALGTAPVLAASTHSHSTAPAHASAAAAIDAITGTGVVRNVDAAHGKVTLQHEPIERLGWPAMTMAFQVRDAKLLEGLAPGKKVRFAFVRQGPAYVITAIE